MRRAWILIALLALSPSCFLFRGDLPDDSCESDKDCFRAQGEVCDLQSKQCVIPADAAPLIDAPPTPDAAPVPDAGPTPDAQPTPDAGTPDA